MTDGTRIEQDSLGQILVPQKNLWGAQTERSRRHFAIGSPTKAHQMPQEIISALLLIKRAAAKANAELGIIEENKARIIEDAAASLSTEEIEENFPLTVWQTGSGTQTNMNVNEVIANKAAALAGMPLGQKKPIHPNDDVNRSQSSNDTFPTAMHIAFCSLLHSKLYPAIDRLIEALKEQEIKFAAIVKIGRTHLMDAVPMHLSDEFSAFRSQMIDSKQQLLSIERQLHELALGGTAIGSGINCPAGFAEKTIAILSEWTQLPFVQAKNLFAALASHDSALGLSGALKRLAISFMKMANDIRLLGSGPRAGIGELRLPENEPGSSIMPGKINPTQCEAMTQVACQIIGNDAAVTAGCAQGQLQLNTFKPMIAKNCIESIHLLSDTAASFTLFCLNNLQANREQIDQHVARSLMLATALTPKLGYDIASKAALYAHQKNLSLKEAVLKLTSMTEAEFDAICDPQKMAGG